MTKQRDQHFDEASLRRLIQNELEPGEEQLVSDHIAECEQCRTDMERMAGRVEWWDEVELCLSSAAPHLASSAAPAVSPTADLDIPTAASAADFAVDFLEPTDHPEALGRLAEFEILEFIGHGGMGIVLKGFQPDLGRYVAIKVMAPHLAVSGSARKRFEREARAAAAIVHPNVMAIHSVDANAKLPFLVMPYVHCESLQQRIDREGPLETSEVLRIMNQTAAALAAAHSQGLVHRDIKPANILLEKGVDRVLLTDFGLARAVDDASLTRTGAIAGTPQYMSPEQARGDSIDGLSDLFSLGAVGYTMCAGRPPFRAETSYAVMRRIIDADPRPLQEVNAGVPGWFTILLDLLLAKDPQARIQSADDVARICEQCLAHVQQPNLQQLPPECDLPAPVKPRRAVRVVIGLTAACLLCLAAWSVGAGWWGDGQATQASSEQGQAASGALADTAKQPNVLANESGVPFEREQLPASMEWNDQIENELGGLEYRLQVLETEVQESWDTTTK